MLAWPLLAAGLAVGLLVPPAAAASSLAGKVIVVDPGHGGRDPGAIANGLREKDVTLAIGTDLANDLRAQGAQVVMTRSTDVALGATTDEDLQARVNIARNAHANAFISVHANFTADPGYSGATTYYGPQCGYYSNASLSPTDVGRGYSLAQRVQSAVVARTGEVNRGAQAQVYWVLGDPGIPSILLETGFLSNQAEAGKLANPAYQQTVASAIADGFASFFSSGDASGTPSAPADALGGCSGQAPTAPQPAVRWLQTFLPTGLLSGTDPHAQTFAELAPFTYLKLVGQSGNFYEVINPKTSGPGFVDATKVGPSGPPPAFTPFWVENFKPVSLLSGAGAGAVSFGTLPPWNFFQVVAPSTGSRFYAKVGTTGNVAYVDRASVGPSGPPPPPGSTAAPATTAGPAIPAPAPATKQIQVAAGDTLFAISQRVGVNVSDLIAANHLSAAGAIQAGQTLLIPGGQVEAAPAPAAPKTVVIRPGDTLLKIANAAGTSVAAILKLNNLADPNAIVAGNTLIVG